MIHPPKFWQQEKGVFSAFLWPLSKLYEFVVCINALRMAPKKVKIPVICIGNLTLGGAGKTPTAIAIARVLKEEHITVHFVSRGYGRKSMNIKQVDPNTDTSETVGDEPLLLAQVAPTWVSSDRAAAIDLAYEQGAEIVILDDGLQNKSIHKDLSILVVDSKLGFGNGCVFPAGPLRGSIEKGMQGVDAVLMVGPVLPSSKACHPRPRTLSLKVRDPEKRWVPDLQKYLIQSGISLTKDDTLLCSTAIPLLTVPKEITSKKVIAFAGIAYPDKFFEGLKSAGIEILEECAFPDHHHLSAKEFQKLLKKSQKYKAPLVTTQKDFVRLDTKQRPLVTPISYHLKLEDAFIQFMKQKTNELI